MNNLKRVLSLGLAGTMLSGMMAMGASAKDFTDADKIENVDAVNTLVALNIINGKDDGSFDPQGNVTRGEMAKMIAVTMNGGNETSTGVKTNPTFTDIKGHWAESYIEYCADMKIISGRGDGTFDPNGEVTGLEATKMVLTALGYDATAYQLTGGSWAVRTDELARQASPKLYEELDGVMMAANATRETAAQLIWNGLQNTTRKVEPNKNTSNGEVTWNYVDGSLMLTERFGAKLYEGTYVGNYETGDASFEGEIVVDSYSFPSDLGIENIGEEVKVIWKDGKGGSAGPDRKDTIYGVFNTGKTEVYTVAMNDLQSNSDADKIKFDGVKHDAAAVIDVRYNYDSTTDTTMTPAQIKATSGTGMRIQSGDTIKFVCDTNGVIEAAYVTNYAIGKVTAVTASKVTISGVGAIDIDDNDIYEDVAKDDVVVYTKYYDSDNSDAFFTVEKAETVEGKLTGYKYDSSVYVNVVVDGETYKVEKKAANFPNLTDDAITTPSASDIKDGVRLFLVNGFVAALESTEDSTSNYAVIVDAETSGTLTSSLDPWRVTLLLADNTEVTRNVHKESVSDNGTTAVTTSNVVVGALVKYTTLNDTTVKIVEIASAAAAITGTGTGNAKFWNSDTKELTTTGTTLKTAANGALLFVARDLDTPTDGIDSGDAFDAYNLRSLDDINNTVAGVSVSYFLKDGLVEAAYAVLTNKPSSDSSDTLYGIVTSYEGTRTNDDDETLYRYTVAVNRDEEVVVDVTSAGLAKGWLVSFDERADGEYAAGDFTKIVTADDTTATGWTLIAIDDYKESTRLLTGGSKTTWNATSKVYEISSTDVVAFTVASDVVVTYVDGDEIEDGAAVGIAKTYDSSNGYANAVVHKNDKGVVNAIIIETSGDANLAHYTVEGTKTSKFGN